MTHTMVVTQNRSTHGPIGQAPATTLGSSGKSSGAAGASGAGTLNTSSNGSSTTHKTPVGGASNTGNTRTTTTGGGGGLQQTVGHPFVSSNSHRIRSRTAARDPCGGFQFLLGPARRRNATGAARNASVRAKS
jgi:hypothetical protein